MNFFNLFHKKSKLFYLYLGFLGIINSVWAGALLILINNKVTGTPLPYFDDYALPIFVALIIVSFSIAHWFQSYMIKLTYHLGNELSLSIFDKLRFSTYESFLKISEEKVRTAERDARTIQNFPIIFMETFNALVLMLIGIGYLFFVNVIGATIVLVVMAILAAVYIYRIEKVQQDQGEVRNLADTYMQNINDFLRGFKEVKMNQKISNNIFEKHISANRNKSRDVTIRYYIRALGSELSGTYAWYVMIGIVLFALPAVITMDMELRTNFMITLLFLMDPVSTIIGVMDDFSNMAISIDRLNKFNNAVDDFVSAEKNAVLIKKPGEAFRNIRFENVVYEYLDKDKSTRFRLKPLNINIERGECIFITGGNGSGKSTFINLLSGLYAPKSGQIYLNDEKVTEENYPSYRDQIACIFTDNYLFSENYEELDLDPSNSTFMALLEKMQLQSVVTFEEGNKVSHTLSKGQQKRMALIYSLLADKEVLIFDEWAAEQDPVFRKYFYKTIIPELKAMGKTVIAVTHDDAYFDCAERLIKFDYGQIIKDARLEPVLA